MLINSADAATTHTDPAHQLHLATAHSATADALGPVTPITSKLLTIVTRESARSRPANTVMAVVSAVRPPAESPSQPKTLRLELLPLRNRIATEFDQRRFTTYMRVAHRAAMTQPVVTVSGFPNANRRASPNPGRGSTTPLSTHYSIHRKASGKQVQPCVAVPIPSDGSQHPTPTGHAMPRLTATRRRRRSASAHCRGSHTALSASAVRDPVENTVHACRRRLSPAPGHAVGESRGPARGTSTPSAHRHPRRVMRNPQLECDTQRD